MPLNQLKKYNLLLELSALNPTQRNHSLKGIFDRDITHNNSFIFRGKQISPTPKDGEIKMSTLFTHLTTEMVDNKTRERIFEMDRSVRLHWVKYHIDENKKDKMYVFSVKEPEGNRTYIYDIDEKYVIILEPLRKVQSYYLITAYYVKGKDAKRDKIMKKYKRKLNDIL